MLHRDVDTSADRLVSVLALLLAATGAGIALLAR
jgi:hypothetical protein